MKRLRDVVNWPKEIREFIIEKVDVFRFVILGWTPQKVNTFIYSLAPYKADKMRRT